jgi:hypothetical protein
MSHQGLPRFVAGLFARLALGMTANRLLLAALFSTSLVACAGPNQSPVVDNRSNVAYYARVGGVSDDQATARVVELPPGARTSLVQHAGLPDLFMTDVAILDGQCTEIGHWEVKDVFVGEGPGWEGSIIIQPDGLAVWDESDPGSAGSQAVASDRCPPGPSILP